MTTIWSTSERPRKFSRANFDALAGGGVNAQLSPFHSASDTQRQSDMITLIFNGELATSGDKSDSDHWRRNVDVSSDADQATKVKDCSTANEQRILRATTNRSEESVSGAHTSPSWVHTRQDRFKERSHCKWFDSKDIKNDAWKITCWQFTVSLSHHWWFLLLIIWCSEKFSTSL